jgi:hypothetical protein
MMGSGTRPRWPSSAMRKRARLVGGLVDVDRVMANAGGSLSAA